MAITVSGSTLAAHGAHQDRQDLVPAPAGGCPLDPTPVAYNGPVVLCTVSAGVLQTARTVTGTNGDDTIDCTGTVPRKRILGLAGNDTVSGGFGNDSLIARPADAGADTVNGDAGVADTCTGVTAEGDTFTGCEM